MMNSSKMSWLSFRLSHSILQLQVFPWMGLNPKLQSLGVVFVFFNFSTVTGMLEVFDHYLLALESRCGSSTLRCNTTDDWSSNLLKLMWGWENGSGLGNNCIRGLTQLLYNPESILEELRMGGSMEQDETVFNERDENAQKELLKSIRLSIFTSVVAS